MTVTRNATALMISTVTSAALGFGFWVAAAHWFAPAVVGQAAAFIAAMTLLAGVSQLNLVSLYARFLPTAGARTGRLVGTGMAASVVTSVVLATAFLAAGAGRAFVSPGLATVVFVVAVIATGLSFIVDGVLTPLGRARWVPAKNIAIAAAKLALLAVLAVASIEAAPALTVAWTVPVAIAVIVLGTHLARRVVARHSAATATFADSVPPRRGEIASFVSAEYLNGLIANAVAFVPPVLVSHLLGTASSAYFYVPWLVGVSATTLLWNIVTSYVVSAAGDPAGGTAAHGAGTHLRRATQLGLLVVVPATLILTTAATPLLTVVGAGYAEHGALALRLIGASLPFTALLLAYSAFCVMDKRMWTVVLVGGVSTAAFLAASWLGLPRFGLVAPALAYLVTQAAAGLAVAPAVLRRYRAVRGLPQPVWRFA